MGLHPDDHHAQRRPDHGDPATTKYSLTTDAEKLDGFDVTFTADITCVLNKAT